MKTSAEIIARIKNDHSDIFGFSAGVLVPYLDFAEAKEFLKEGTDEATWNKEKQALTRESVLAEMKDYMDFALEKATGHRGISASRSVEKFKAWVWLLGDEAKIDFEKYAQYGMPILKSVCETYGFEFEKSESAERMARGESCYAGCEEGCGS